MIGHWILSAWRSMRSDKLFAFLSILSLAIGAAAALLVGGYVREELSYERWLPDGDRILRIEGTNTRPNGEVQASALAPNGLAPLLERAAPSIQAQTRLRYEWLTVERGDLRFNERVAFVDPTFFDVFAIEVVEGDLGRALKTPNSIVLTRAAKARFFGDRPALGETVDLFGPNVVAAVVEDLPRATHLELGGVIAPLSHPAIRVLNGEDFLSKHDNWGVSHYVLADSRTAAEALERGLPAVVLRLVEANSTLPDDRRIAFEATPIRSIHLDEAKTGDEKPRGDARQLALFSGVAAALLLVAAFNYVTMSLARALRRTREVGMRKALGAGRAGLARQYLFDSLLFTLVAVVLGFAIAEFVLPWFARAIGRELSLDVLHDGRFLLWAAAGVLGLALIVGAYPAFYLSSIRPAAALQGRTGSGPVGAAVTTALLVLQFAAAIALLTAVLLIWQQVRHISERPLGFSFEDRVVIHGVQRGPSETAARLETFKRIVASDSAVRVASGAGAMPNWDHDEYGALSVATAAGQQELRAIVLPVDYDYLRALDVRLIAGRHFSQEQGLDRAFAETAERGGPERTSAIITRAGLRGLGVDRPEAAVGRQHRLKTSDGGSVEIEIVGVVEDLHLRTLRHVIEPTIFLPDPTAVNAYLVHYDGARRAQALATVERAWAATYPEQQIARDDLEEEMRGLYEEDRRLLRLVAGCAIATVLAASLGLYGLAGYAARARVREIGLRKALGASSASVLRLMLARFGKPLLIAHGVGWPLAYIALRDWFSSYAYRPALSPWPFIAAGAVVVSAAVVAVLATSWRAAAMRPGLALREPE